MARESGRIPIIVALITAVAGIITAWITTRHHDSDRPSEVQAQQAPTATPANAPPEALQNLSNGQAAALGAETKALDDVTRQIEAANANRTTH